MFEVRHTIMNKNAFFLKYNIILNQFLACMFNQDHKILNIPKQI